MPDCLLSLEDIDPSKTDAKRYSTQCSLSFLAFVWKLGYGALISSS